MQKFIFGLVIGLTATKIKRYYDFEQFAKNNPDDPRVTERRAEIDEMKAAIKKFVDDTKAGWNQAATKMKFEEIVKDVEDDVDYDK